MIPDFLPSTEKQDTKKEDRHVDVHMAIFLLVLPNH